MREGEKILFPSLPFSHSKMNKRPKLLFLPLDPPAAAEEKFLSHDMIGFALSYFTIYRGGKGESWVRLFSRGSSIRTGEREISSVRRDVVEGNRFTDLP